jgi:hypothetical protein
MKGWRPSAKPKARPRIGLSSGRILAGHRIDRPVFFRGLGLRALARGCSADGKVSPVFPLRLAAAKSGGNGVPGSDATKWRQPFTCSRERRKLRRSGRCCARMRKTTDTPWTNRPAARSFSPHSGEKVRMRGRAVSRRRQNRVAPHPSPLLASGARGLPRGERLRMDALAHLTPLSRNLLTIPGIEGKNGPGGRRNPLQRLISAKEIKGNPRIFL